MNLKDYVIENQKIIDLVKNFELTIEIEKYLDDIGLEEEELDFDDFCKLFSNPGE